MTSILSDTFAPPRTATNGRSGDARASPRYFSSSSIRKPAAGLRQQLRHALGRRVRAMARSERVVHVEVGELRQLLRERRVVLLLLLVEADVLEQRRGCGPEPAPARWPSSPARRRSRWRSSPRWSSSRARCAATGFELNSGLGPPFGPPEVRGQDHGRPVLERVLDGRQRRADARVVLDAPFLDGHVEVHADEDALARADRDHGSTASPRYYSLTGAEDAGPRDRRDSGFVDHTVKVSFPSPESRAPNPGGARFPWTPCTAPSRRSASSSPTRCRTTRGPSRSRRPSPWCTPRR